MKNYGICQLSVVPVRKSPVSTSEMVTQIIFGEIFSIVKHEEKWSIVSNEFDNYQGWVNNSQIKFIEKKDFELLKSNMPVHCLDNKGYIKNANKEIISVPLGSLISSCFFLETIYFGNTSISTKNDLIKNNFRKVEEWANKTGVKTIDVKIKKFDPFFNINTKEDFEEAKKILKEN